MKTKINIGIIGAGRIGHLHCKNLVLNIAGAEVLMVSDILEEQAVRLAKEFNISHASKDYMDIIENENIDAVLICSSTDTHHFMIEEAAKAGKHIFCEKPIDFDLKKIDSALNAVEQAGVKLQIGFNRRFDANFKKAREIIKQGRIGKLSTFKITSRDPAPPPIEYLERCGGIFADMTIHDFDMARYISGSEVDEVYVSGGVLVNEVCRQAGDLDTVVVILKFKNGIIGMIENSRSTVYGYDQRLEAFGSEGMVNVGNKLLDTVELTDSECTRKSLLPHFFLERYNESFIEEMKEFVECIKKDADPPVAGIDGKIPILMAKAAKLSHDRNKPVRIDELN